MNVFKNLQQILTGVRNHYIGKPEIEALVKKRAMICATCPDLQDAPAVLGIKNKNVAISNKVCGLCKCPASWRLSNPHVACKANKWKEETTPLLD